MRAVTVLLSCICVFSLNADIVISGFNAGEHPFENISTPPTSLTLNPDGSQTVFNAPEYENLWWLTLPLHVSDLSEGRRNNVIQLRVRREPDNTASGVFRLDFLSSRPIPDVVAVGNAAVAYIPYDAFAVGEFTTYTIPFSSFQNQIDGVPAASFDSMVHANLMDPGLNARNRTHLTFDSLVAIQIPEPGTAALLVVAVAVLVFRSSQLLLEYPRTFWRNRLSSKINFSILTRSER